MKTMKRIISFVLVIALLLTMPACATINGEPASFLEMIFFLVKGVHYVTVMLTIGAVSMGIALVCDALDIDPDWPWVDSFRTWLINTQGKMEANLYGTEYIPLETETVEMDHFYADDEGTDGEEKKEKNFLQRLWAKITCKHEPEIFEQETFTVSCYCGKKTFHELSFQEFQECVPEELRDDFAAYRRYYLLSNGMDQETFELVSALNPPDIEQIEKDRLKGAVEFLSEAAGLISESAGVADTLVPPNMPKDIFLELVSEYFGVAGNVLLAIKVSSAFAEADKAFEEKDDRQMVSITMELLTEATSIIPVAGVAFGTTLETAKQGIQVILDNFDLHELRYAVLDAEKNGWALAQVRNYSYIQEKGTWSLGPRLEELAAANLTQEEILTIFPYIEFRFRHETEKMFNKPIEEVLQTP